MSATSGQDLRKVFRRELASLFSLTGSERSDLRIVGTAVPANLAVGATATASSPTPAEARFFIYSMADNLLDRSSVYEPTQFKFFDCYATHVDNLQARNGNDQVLTSTRGIVDAVRTAMRTSTVASMPTYEMTVKGGLATTVRPSYSVPNLASVSSWVDGVADGSASGAAMSLTVPVGSPTAVLGSTPPIDPSVTAAMSGLWTALPFFWTAAAPGATGAKGIPGFTDPGSLTNPPGWSNPGAGPGTGTAGSTAPQRTATVKMRFAGVKGVDLAIGPWFEAALMYGFAKSPAAKLQQTYRLLLGIKPRVTIKVSDSLGAALVTAATGGSRTLGVGNTLFGFNVDNPPAHVMPAKIKHDKTSSTVRIVSTSNEPFLIAVLAKPIASS